MANDLYELLGVDRGASLTELRRAYRDRARTAHPDRAGDAASMAAINEAWAVLSDPKRRAEYDRSIAPDPADHAEGWEPPVDRLMDAGPQRLLRAMIVIVVVFLVVLSLIVFLVGFGRVGA